ncbi:hypothetical protein [Aminobacter sp. MSH1]|uniref:hypothetical protein n=1 Tax=Aminobacter sp. MSH1 TaxID=374606 RepID=UPI000D3A79B3|nr:hypothetical protein [Aminobacter sp. MSH1]
MRKDRDMLPAMPPKLEDGTPTERIQIVAPQTWVARIEEWRRKQPRIPSKSEAIRILVDKALDSGNEPD